MSLLLSVCRDGIMSSTNKARREMKLCGQLFVLLALVFGLAACDRGSNGECFDHPDRFAAELEKDARTSVQPGATMSEVRQFCVRKRLLIVEKESEVFCTAEAHRGLSRCDVTLDFKFGEGATLASIAIDKPRFKNP
jgi:hypothetical protein